MNRESLRKRTAFAALLGYQRIGEFVLRWTRLEYGGPAYLPTGPALLVSNHGFGTIYDMNAFVLGALLKNHRRPDHPPFTILAHDAAWTLGLGQWLEPAGLKPANRRNALDALAAGHLVVVLPGGDIDAGKDFRHRNEVLFGGRSGFASIAMEAEVPIVPIVISGAGETALVLSDGKSLAKWLGLRKFLRLKTFPISLSIPWGLSFGLSGMALPYLPLPAKMRASVLEPMHARPQESADAYAARVLHSMNERMQAMTQGRIPVLGVRWPVPIAQPPKNGFRNGTRLVTGSLFKRRWL